MRDPRISPDFTDWAPSGALRHPGGRPVNAARNQALLNGVPVNRGGAIDEKLGRRNEEAAALFDSSLQAVEDRAGVKLRDVSTTLESLLMRIDDTLSLRGRALTEMLARNTLETAKALGDGGRELTQGMDAKSAEIGETLQRRATRRPVRMTA